MNGYQDVVGENKDDGGYDEQRDERNGEIVAETARHTAHIWTRLLGEDDG